MEIVASARPGRELLGLFDRVVASLRRMRIRHMLIGGWALGVLGQPRATLDLDFMVLAEGEDLDRVAAGLERAGLLRDSAWQKQNPMRGGIEARLDFKGIAVDVLAPRDEHDRHAPARRKRKKIDSRFHWKWAKRLGVHEEMSYLLSC